MDEKLGEEVTFTLHVNEPASIKVIPNEFMPPGIMVVSQDVFELFLQQGGLEVKSYKLVTNKEGGTTNEQP